MAVAVVVLVVFFTRAHSQRCLALHIQLLLAAAVLVALHATQAPQALTLLSTLPQPLVAAAAAASTLQAAATVARVAAPTALLAQHQALAQLAKELAAGVAVTKAHMVSRAAAAAVQL
jgi:hypothetical protein